VRGRSHPTVRAPCRPPRPPCAGVLRGKVTAPAVGIARRRWAAAAAVAAAAPVYPEFAPPATATWLYVPRRALAAMEPTRVPGVHASPSAPPPESPGYCTHVPRIAFGSFPAENHVPTSAYPVPPSRLPTISDFDKGCLPPRRAARLFLGRCGAPSILIPPLCTRLLQQPSLQRILVHRHGQGNCDGPHHEGFTVRGCHSSLSARPIPTFAQRLR